MSRPATNGLTARRSALRTRRLTRVEFARALRLGLGRARIDVRRNGLRGREDLLVAACLRDASQIRELEGSTAGWLVGIARDGRVLGRVSRAVRRAAARPFRRASDRAHAARVLKHLAWNGDAAARQSLLAMLRSAPDEDLVRVGVPVVELLGEDGWRNVVAAFRARARVSPSMDLGWLAFVARETLGTRRALATLARVAGNEPPEFVRRMRDAFGEVGKRRSRREKDPRTTSTLDELERWVSSPRRSLYFRLHRWAESACLEDCDTAWRRIRAEKDSRRLRRRLWAMASAEPPRLRSGMFALARHEHPRVRSAAVDLLERIRHPRVRKWALTTLRRDSARAVRDGVLGLLEMNGRHSDSAVVAAVLPASRSAEADHEWVRGVLGAAGPFDPRTREFAHRTGPAWDPLLVSAWDIAPCRDCRRSVFDVLAKRGSAPEWMIREAVWDSQDETRAIARRALRKARGRRRHR